MIQITISEFERISLIENREQRVYEAAMAYVDAGINIIPLRPNTKVLPPQSTGINYTAASKKRSVVEKWFHPTDGKFAGWNIGIACGRKDGVWALDVDQHGGADGHEELEHILESNEQIIRAPMAQTPNGGNHYLFLWQEGAVSSTGKIGKAIDSRGGTEFMCKSHIAVFPSVVDGRPYKWINGGPVPSTPQWLADRVGMAWKKPKVEKPRGSEEVGPEDTEEKVPVDQIERMLKHIEINDLSYEDWLQVGQAIHSQYPDDEGLRLWGEWSRNGERYKPGECTKRWDGFDESGNVRMGTLFHHAMQHGWSRRPTIEPDAETLDEFEDYIKEIVDRMNKEFAVVSLGGKVRILREMPGVKNPMLEDFHLHTVNDFKHLMANKQHTISNGNKARTITEDDIWMASPDRREFPHGIGLFPNGAPAGYYNTWRGFAVEPRKGDASLWWVHLNDVICSGNEEYAQWLTDWMADCVQDPENPKGTAIVMKGEEGTGKGTLADTFGQLFGRHYIHLIDDYHLTSNFNAIMMNALVVFADEITWGGNKKSAGKLKGMVTEKWAVGERKGIDAFQYRNMIRMLIASNEEWVIPAGPQSRRWFVLNVAKHKRVDRSYFAPIYDQLANGGVEAILYDLMEREVTHNLAVAPETTELGVQRVLNQERDSVIEWFSEKVHIGHLEGGEDELGKEQPWPRAMSSVALYNSYCRWCEIRHDRPRAMVTFRQILDKLGFIASSRRRTNRGRIQILGVPSLFTAQTILSREFGIAIDEGEENE